ncbi:Os12g0168500 [Oryza sativa Japonica Group]|uniref:Os12g0168500 protein n=1 Tax=Oryza sativa subsp. japonica TaxID=39947 RepID=C7JA36_ORYSJ|nr:Os12g0168500 [Oryza sativa Japonica Group]|eukprot:NP_001176807.1 Os12g0168500 [Oryza sativa Japonica Group]
MAIVVDSELMANPNPLEPLCVVPPTHSARGLSASKVADSTESSTSETKLLVLICVVPPIQTGQGAFVSEVTVSTEPATKEAYGTLPNVFDNVEEYICVNGKGLYIDVPPIPSTDGAEPSVPTQTYGPSETFGVAEPYAEVEVNDDDSNELNVLHNLEMPIPTRYITKCKHIGCKWRIHASKLHDDRIIQRLSFPHECPTTKLMEGKMASQGWIADRLSDWLKKNPQRGPKDAKEKLEEKYEIKVKYSKAWLGVYVALDQIHGKYEENFQLLFNWKAEIEKKSPDGFLNGCKPYIGVDATRLTEIEAAPRKRYYLLILHKLCIANYHVANM